jgi:AAHS family 4-hydroxybenzoate transporter-like MFS transporter
MLRGRSKDHGQVGRAVETGDGGSSMKDDGGVTLDVGDIIDEGRWTGFQKLILALASLAFIIDALANQVMSISIPAMIRDWHVHRGAFSPIIAMGWVGVAVGAVIAGYFSDRLGRKTMLLASIGLFGAATAACGLVSNLHGLLLLRTLDGVGIGGAIPAATTLIAEFTPVRRRSRAVNIGMICIPLGNFLCGSIGSVVLPHFGWRALFAVNGGISLLIGVTLLVFLPESPRFLNRMPRRRDEFLRGLKQLKIDAPAGAHWAAGAAARKGGQFSALFDSGSVVTTLAIWGGFFFCFLSVYTSLTWVPSLLSGHGYSLAVTSLTLAVSGVGGMFGSLIMASLVERFGSRVALVIATFVAAAGALTLTQIPLDPRNSVIPLMIALGIVSLSLNAVTGCIYALAAYVYPPAVKGTGLGTAAAVGRMGAITSSYAAVAMIGIGSQAFFGFIAAAIVLAMGSLMVLRTQIPSDTAFVRGAAAIH